MLHAPCSILHAPCHQAESARLVDTGSQASKIKTLIVNMTEELEPDTGAAASKSEMETLSAEVTNIETLSAEVTDIETLSAEVTNIDMSGLVGRIL